MYEIIVLPIKISGLAGSGIGSPRVVVLGSLFIFSVCLLLKHSTFFSVLLARFSCCLSLRSFTLVL